MTNHHSEGKGKIMVSDKDREIVEGYNLKEMFWNLATMSTGTVKDGGDKWTITKKDWNELADKFQIYLDDAIDIANRHSKRFHRLNTVKNMEKLRLLDENRALEEQIQKMHDNGLGESWVEKFEKRVCEKDQQIAELQEERNAFQTQAGARKKETFLLKTRINELQEENGDRKIVESDVHKQLIKMTNYCEKFLNENRELKEKLEESLQETHGAILILDDKNKEIAKLQEELENEYKETKKWRVDSQKMNKENRKIHKEIDNLYNELDITATATNKLQAIVDKLQEENTEIKIENTALYSQIDKLQTIMDRVDEEEILKILYQHAKFNSIILKEFRGVAQAIVKSIKGEKQ